MSKWMWIANMGKAVIKLMVSCLLFAFIVGFISCEKETAEIDITEIIEKAKEIADSNFSVDISGIPYEKNKPWLVTINSSRTRI